jgi:hypothetical protein
MIRGKATNVRTCRQKTFKNATCTGGSFSHSKELYKPTDLSGRLDEHDVVLLCFVLALFCGHLPAMMTRKDHKRVIHSLSRLLKNAHQEST